MCSTTQEEISNSEECRPYRIKSNDLHSTNICKWTWKTYSVDDVKYFGMYPHSHLSWEYHLHELSKKLSRANGIISKLRNNAPFDICLHVYYAFYSHLIYDCNIWELATKENRDKIEILQKKCIRILTFSPFKSHISDLFKDLTILKVKDIIKMHQLKVVFDFTKMLCPVTLYHFSHLQVMFTQITN